MATYVMEDDWDKEDIGLTYQICETAINKIANLHIRLIGRICSLAQEIELAIGLDALEKQDISPAEKSSMQA